MRFPIDTLCSKLVSSACNGAFIGSDLLRQRASPGKLHAAPAAGFQNQTT